jgi:phosphoadenosine phosphosulfate reductase
VKEAVMTSHAQEVRIDGRAVSVEIQTGVLSAILESARPELILELALKALPLGSVAAVSSFGAEAAMLLHMISRIELRTPILFIDTGHLFPETLAYRDALVAQLGLKDVRSVGPAPADLAASDSKAELWRADPDLCCHIRKVLPLAAALDGFCAWINGRKRYQGGERKGLAVVEADGSRLKFNPLAHFDRAMVQAYFAEHNLPPHPLEAHGFRSIGCLPCTSRTRPGEEARAGRWRGRGKTECGIHGAPGKVTLYEKR